MIDAYHDYHGMHASCPTFVQEDGDMNGVFSSLTDAMEELIQGEEHQPCATEGPESQGYF